MHYVDVKNTPDVAAQFQVFALPTILIYFQGKEYYRFSRNIGVNELREAIARPYGMVFSQQLIVNVLMRFEEVSGEQRDEK